MSEEVKETRELLVRYVHSTHNNRVEVLGRPDTVHVHLDVLFDRGAKVKDSWKWQGGRMLLLEVDKSIEMNTLLTE